jgi:hypothetical protein
LVIKNAKTYNAPDTVYYKAAEKLLSAGLKIIEKETAVVVPDPVVEHAPTIVYSPPPIYEQKPIITRKHTPKIREDTKRTRKVKHWEELEDKIFDRFNMDGTLFIDEETNHERRHKFANPFQRFAFFQDLELLESLQFVDNDVYSAWNIAYIPSIKGRMNHPKIENTILGYGNDRGQQYITSLETFAQGLDPSIYNLDQALEHLTRGAHQVRLETKKFISNQPCNPTMTVECGQVSIEKEIEECKKELDTMLRDIELEPLRKAASKCSMLFHQGEVLDMSNMTAVDILNQNAYELQSIHGTDRIERMERIRKRLAYLVQYSNDISFETGRGVTVRVIQPTYPPRPMSPSMMNPRNSMNMGQRTIPNQNQMNPVAMQQMMMNQAMQSGYMAGNQVRNGGMGSIGMMNMAMPHQNRTPMQMNPNMMMNQMNAAQQMNSFSMNMNPSQSNPSLGMNMQNPLFNAYRQLHPTMPGYGGPMATCMNCGAFSGQPSDNGVNLCLGNE